MMEKNLTSWVCSAPSTYISSMAWIRTGRTRKSLEAVYATRLGKCNVVNFLGRD